MAGSGISEQERDFLKRRAGLIRAWRYVGPLLILSVITVTLAFIWNYPLIANPLYVAEQLKAGALSASTLETQALILPVVFLTVFFVLLAMQLFLWVMLKQEKRYHEIIEKLQENNKK